MLVMQNGRTIFEHYANGGSADARWPIFSGTKSFWGIAALVAVRDGLIRLDDRVADTITEWKSPAEAGRKSQITIRQLLNFTDGIEPAPHLHRESIRDRNAMAIRLSIVARAGIGFHLWAKSSSDFLGAAPPKTKRPPDVLLFRCERSQSAWPQRR